MKNFPYKIESDLIVDGENVKGKTFWYSRATAVAVFMFAFKGEECYVLANKRGSGCPNFVGYWSCPCGYVDFNETIFDAAIRELNEESGLTPSEYGLLKLQSINDAEMTFPQNITFRFIGFIDDIEELPRLTDRFSEPNEIEEQAWININELSNYSWAFNHEKLIKEFYDLLGI